MSQDQENNDPVQPEFLAETEEGSREDFGTKNPRRKLRYDAPTLDVPRPLYLRAKDDQSDEDAA